MKYIFVCLCLLHSVLGVEIQLGANNRRDSRKLFGGYRITPRFCKPTRKSTLPMGGPNICMFNHECSQRNGQVVGACMDGFLFGACCQLPTDSTGELIESDINPVTSLDNHIATSTMATVDIMSHGVSQIAQTLLNPGILPTAQDNVMVQISDQPSFSTTGVTHTTAPETMILNGISNTIHPNDFRVTTKAPVVEDRKTTVRIEDTTVPYSQTPTIHISISNAPSHYTPSPGFQKPMFRPKPSKPSDADKYVLVPTISHTTRPNKTQEVESIVNILQMLNETSTNNPYYGYTSKKPPSTSYVYSPTSTRRPGYDPTTSKKPPSTSYVYSTTVKPRRTTTPLTTTTKRKTTKPTKNSNKKTTPVRIKNPYNTTPRPSGHSTVANSPLAFVSSARPPSTSYIYNNIPTRRPPSTVSTHIAGPGFSVTSSPDQFSTYPSPAPTLIVLSPVPDDEIITKQPLNEPNYGPPDSIYSSPRPPYLRPSSSSNNKPINSVTINNHVTQNIYSTERPQPQPTVLITPKPSVSSSLTPLDYNTAAVEVETSADQLINFPPVRNPNLNMSNPVINDDDITTPAFVEDDILNDKVESFVNKIIQGLQEPFQGLRDVVYNKNSTSTPTTTKKPVKKQGTTTKKPPAKPSSTKPASRPSTRPSSRPTSRPATSRPATTRPTRSTTVRRPVSSVPTRRPTTTTKRPKTTKRPQTTTQSFIEEDNTLTSDSEQYRDQCGIRPLLKTGRIVGGKDASYGEFPWQVLVRESTWLGLFTKNKCGGVLISNKYVMTAAHCQPGFLASLVAVFGEFDISGNLESRRPVSRNVRKVIVHRKYDAATFENDLALLELESPVKFDAHIIPICLPRDGEDFTGRIATVTGWGRLKYGGGVPSVLQEVQVPIMENHVCQEMFRTAGHTKVILESFVCAGYANGQRDSCEGDSGGPLVLQRPDGRYQLAGTVSHGIKCAAPYLPGVYMRTTYFKPWIVAITGIDSS